LAAQQTLDLIVLRRLLGSMGGVDLMMDYSRVLYADLLEWRNKIAFTEAATIREDQALNEIATGMEENHIPLETTPEVAAPAIELDITSTNYESVQPKSSEQDSPFVPPHHSGADIMKLIGINDKYQFISELFSNNKEAFDEVILEINSFESEEEALQWLHHNVYQEYRWNDEMKSFTS